MPHLHWRPKTQNGFEALFFDEEASAFFGDSVVLGIEEGEAFRLHYRLWLNLQWQVISFRIGHLLYGAEYRFSRDANDSWMRDDLLGNDEGQWEGCTDLDISCTPFTNSLPIRRLKLEIGQSADINVLFVECPQLRIKTARQRYERLSELEYRFTSLDVDFTATVTVDAEGFVTDYPGLFERRYP
jgi:uncharacterized protein